MLVDSIIKARSQDINHSCEKCLAHRATLNEIMVDTADLLEKVIDLIRALEQVSGFSFRQRAMLSTQRAALKSAIEAMIK